MSDFDEFLELQKNRKANQVKWLERKKEWLAQIDNLYKTFRHLLKPYAKQVKIELEDITVYEELPGSYETSSLIIKFESDTLRLKPIGTYLFGSPGRVDLIGPIDTVRFVLAKPSDIRPTIRILSSHDASLEKIEKMETKLSSFVWKISSNPPSIYYSELNVENLQKAIVKVTHG